MNTNEHVDELVDLYALGALEPAEHDRVERHLEQCPACRSELATSMQVVDLLAWTPEQYAPPAGSFERLVKRVAPPELKIQPRRQGLGERIRTWLVPQGGFRPAFALALVLLALGFGGGNLLLQRRLDTSQALNAGLQAQAQQYQQLAALLGDRDTRLVALPAQDAALQSAHTQLLVNQQRAAIYLTGTGLQQLSDNQVYQLWFIADGTPISAGVFQANQQGQTTLHINATLPAATNLLAGITVEPAGGSAQPTTTPIFLGKL